jgi:hypothetical protein
MDDEVPLGVVSHPVPDPEREAKANEVQFIAFGRLVTRRNLTFLRALQKNGGTIEVTSLDHPPVADLIGKGLVRSCRLRAGPLGVYLDEPGITLTPAGKDVLNTAHLFAMLAKGGSNE